MFTETRALKGKRDRLGRRARPLALGGAVVWPRRAGAAGMVGDPRVVLMPPTGWTARTSMVKVRHDMKSCWLLIVKVRSGGWMRVSPIRPASFRFLAG